MALKSSQLFNEQWIERLKKNAQAKLEKDIDKAVNDISRFYLGQVEKFYLEYDPKVYKRHPSSSILDSGLGLRTFIPFKTSYWRGDVLYVMGGISLNTFKMYPSYSFDPKNFTGYNGRNDWVLYTFSQGIHGLPTWVDKKSGVVHYARTYGLTPLKSTQAYAKEIQHNINTKISLKELRM